MKVPSKLTVEEVAKAIDIPVKSWPGKCFEIASAVVDAGLVEGTAVYGHWTGAVHENSRFSGREGAGFVQHGWVLLPDGYTVMDPTRWVFEAKEPYIFVGEPPDDLFQVCMCGHLEEEHDDGFLRECTCCDDCAGFMADEEDWPYDEGGNQFRDIMRRPCPEWNETQKQYDLDFGKGKSLMLLLTAHAGPWTAEQLHWVVNLPYLELRGFAYEIYKPVIDADMGGLIPIDNRRRAEREHSVAA